MIKTEQAVVRAEMRWAQQYHNFLYPRAWDRKHETSLSRACAAHAKSKKGKK